MIFFVSRVNLKDNAAGLDFSSFFLKLGIDIQISTKAVEVFRWIKNSVTRIAINAIIIGFEIDS